MTILGWHKNLPMHEFHQLVFAKPPMPGWDRTPSGELFAAQLDIVSGKDRKAYEIACEFDDVSDGNFHWSEWLDDGGVFLREGDMYHARFEFQFERDRDFFVEKYSATPTETAFLNDVTRLR